MKKINILFAGMLMVSGSLTTSCSESFLDVESKTESNTETFYKTESDAWRALIGCYAGWRETTSSGTIPIVMSSIMQSDECLAGAGVNDAHNFDAVDQFDQSKAPSYTNLWENDWKTYYVAIDRCNELLTREDQIAWKDQTLRRQYIGEAHALRALCYFDMVRMFENIPLLTVPSSENVTQADPDDVYDLIFADLKYAADSIPADAYPKANAASNDGHITAYGAKGILARAYLYYTGRFGKEPASCTKAEALAACEDIIKSGEFALIPLFKNLWPASSSNALEAAANGTYEEWLANSTYAGPGNKEFVISMKCNYTQDYNGNNDGNRWLINLGIRGIQSIDCSPYGYGWGICTVNPSLYSAYGDGDQRRDATIIDIAGEGIDQKTDFAKNCIGDQREYTGYYVKKYTPMATTDCTPLPILWGAPGDAMTSQWQDVIILRYSDVLLMAAELGSSQAQTYFNMVRQRAYTDADGKLNSKYTELTVSKDNIMKERRLEFAFEGIRYYDLLRQGIDVAANAIAGTIQVTNGGQAGSVTTTADNIKSKNGLCQIPNNQITLSNNVLKQNAGW
ncbi:MAG: RagB/SusD family nutrient uptake outer membrane protein [Prevotella sp.]|nr:RagB/SusD family nutrient uptake outer membrane protein [Prevotella sp.]